MVIRTPESYVVGPDGPAVVVPGKVAAVLQRRLGLDQLRTQVRGLDPELDAVLVALAVVAGAWRARVGIGGSGSGSPPRNSPEPAASSTMTTGAAADLLGMTDRGVRQAIQDGRLPARSAGGRWLIDREDLEHFRAARKAREWPR